LSVLILLVGFGATACGRRLPFNEERIRGKCDITAESDLTAEQALCLGRLAGLRHSKKCPLDVEPIDRDGEPAAVYRIRESCGDLALTVTRRGGRVVAVETGRAAAPSRPGEPG
jgi:hypothetical protein